MSTHRMSVTSLAMALAFVVATTAAAAAKPLERERYEGSLSGDWDGCGFLVEFEGSWSGTFTLKEGRGGDPTPYVTDNHDWEWLNRNPANGKWFTEQGKGVYKDVRITHLDGTVYRFIAQISGSPYSILTSDGRKIVKDRGLLRFQFDVDTQGDADLSNDVFLDDSFVLLADHGAHPVWYMTGDDYCALVGELLG